LEAEFQIREKSEKEEKKKWIRIVPLAECVGSSPEWETVELTMRGNTDNLYVFFSLSLPRISSIIFPCSRQMDRRMVSIG